MSNPFDDENAVFYVLINDEEQYSLWPAFAAVPDGWSIAFGTAPKVECVDFVEKNWTDMRPKSLRESMQGRPHVAV